MTVQAPPPPAHVAPFVAALGEDEAIRFFLTFGGSEVYFPRDPKGNSAMAKAFGIAAVKRLIEELEPASMKARVPLPKKWIAQVLITRGLPVAQIARRLHAADTTVRSWTAPVRDARQPDLFDRR